MQTTNLTVVYDRQYSYEDYNFMQINPWLLWMCRRVLIGHFTPWAWLIESSPPFPTHINLNRQISSTNQAQGSHETLTNHHCLMHLRTVHAFCPVIIHYRNDHVRECMPNRIEIAHSTPATLSCSGWIFFCKRRDFFT